MAVELMVPLFVHISKIRLFIIILCDLEIIWIQKKSEIMRLNEVNVLHVIVCICLLQCTAWKEL